MKKGEIARGSGSDVLLQAFHWNLVKTGGTGTLDGCPESWYRLLTQAATEIAELGFSVVYLPPPWRDDSYWEHGGQHGGGEGYFWQDFDLDSRYGTKAELIELTSALHRLGLKVIVDMVPNHRNRRLMKQDVWPYPGPHWRHDGGDDGGMFLAGDFDLNLAHPEVGARFCRAMTELTEECGVDGWRWDLVWGYGVEHVVSWMAATPKREYLSIGEYWQASADKPDDPMIASYGADERTRILGWARDAGSLAFDVILKREIQSANPANFKYAINASQNALERELVVTYVDNHDTGASPFSAANGWGQKHWECPPELKHRAYAYILSMPGTPMVYWPDCFDWGLRDDIRALIKARKAAGVVASSEWVDLTHHGGFAALVKDAEGEARLALAISSAYPGPGEGWRVAHRRPGEYTVWVRQTV